MSDKPRRKKLDPEFEAAVARSIREHKGVLDKLARL